MKMPHRVAVPALDGRFCPHFGRAGEFLLGDVDPDSGAVSSLRWLARPRKPGECESVPQWLRSLAVDRVLVGGIGAAARQRFAECRIEVVAGLEGDDPTALLLHWVQHRPAGGPAECRPGGHAHRHCRGKTSSVTAAPPEPSHVE